MKEYSINTITYYPTHIAINTSSDFIKNTLGLNGDKNSPYHNKIVSTYSNALTRILPLNLNNLFITLTKSDSIFFRFTSIDNVYEFKLEAFLDYDECDNDDVESTLHIYKNGIKQKSLYGDIDYLCDIVRKIIPITELVYEITLNKDFKEVYGMGDGNVLWNAEGIPQILIANQSTQKHSNIKFGQHAFSGQMG